MEELLKKIKKYKRSVDGPFFCIISDAHETASLLKNVSACGHPGRPRRGSSFGQSLQNVPTR